MKGKLPSRLVLSLSTALSGLMLLPEGAFAQDGSTGGLEEIVVTAQKREQSLQDVPIAVTAVTEENIQANRIFSVNDLSSIAPGLVVKPSPGGNSVPAFTIRGAESFGVVAGSDKQVSIYIDGVYIGSPRGSIFDLPDIQRLEVLRGPQGTLFGRNATAGAISVTTRDPSGWFGGRLEASAGNLDSYRVRATLETPEIGPFSAYFSYVRNYRRGATRNANGGLLWDRSDLSSRVGAQRSSKWLGTVDTNSYFAAVKFEPTDTFKLVYKYDRSDDAGSPDPSGFIAYDASAGGGLLGNFLTALYSSQDVYAAPDGKRPSVVANGWATDRVQRVQGHSATATWQATDDISVKNVFAYRKAYVFGAAAIDGVSSLTFTQEALVPYATLTAFSLIGRFPGIVDEASAQAAIPGFVNQLAPLVGQRFVSVASQSESLSKQWSNELQVNYTSDKLQLTVGGLWFHSKDEAGGPGPSQNTVSFTTLPVTGVIPAGNEGRYFPKATSLAAYAQLEYKILPQLEIVAGARITHDEKTSVFRWDIDGVSQPNIVPPKYSKTKPNFQIGLNWEPADSVLIYGKYATSFVSGGSTGGIAYEPETAKSVELGAKADFFNHRLRTNLALYNVVYNNMQQPSSTTADGSVASVLPALTELYGADTATALLTNLSTFVNTVGKMRARGFELEVAAAPVVGVTLGGSLSYTDSKLLSAPANVLAGYAGVFNLQHRPDWTAGVNATYETPALFGDTTLQFRADGLYRSAVGMSISPAVEVYADGSNSAVERIPGFWLVNGRIALRHLALGPVEGELSLWGKNLTNRKDATNVLWTPLATAANYVEPRTYGAELSIQF